MTLSRLQFKFMFTSACAIAAVAIGLAAPEPGLTLRQEATPGATYTCDAEGIPDATPALGEEHPAGMEMGSPAAGSAMEMEMGIDVIYIDMMIPHHASIIAMSEAALPRLTDERLQEIARAIIDVQSAETEELHGLREDLSGSAMPMPMDDMGMTMMMEMMPGMGSMEEMAMQMDPVAQVMAICEAENPDLAFIDLTIPHHDMAIAASEAVLEQSTNDEVRALAERVIADQQAEIETLQEIRQEQ